jgi:DNA-directed RNA polymerase sigma subunit (sigma70/sigma32)
MTRTAEDRQVDRLMIEWAQGTDPRRQEWARRTLVKRHMGLVHNVARRYINVVGKRHELDDLVQLGVQGLLMGVARFDLRRDVAFSTYVVHWVRHAVTRWTTPVKPYEMRVLVAVHHARREADHELSERELAELLGVPERRVRRVLAAAATPSSLDRPPGEVAWAAGGEDVKLSDMLADPDAVPADARLEADDTASYVRRAIDKLPTKERIVIERRFGFHTGDSDDGEQHEEIGARWGVSRQRVQQIQAKAMERLAKLLEEVRP